MISLKISLQGVLLSRRQSGGLRAHINSSPHSYSKYSGLLYTNDEKANAIALNLESQFQGNNIADYDAEMKVKEALRSFLREDNPPTLEDPVTHTDVCKEIKKLPNKKVPAVSGITNERLKNLPVSYIPKLTH